jgi:polyisoprenoid-binding protein YceI
MKKITFPIAIAALLFTASCNNPSSDTATTGDTQQTAVATGKEYVADAAATTIKWRATHKGGLAPRFGTLNITNGDLTAKEGQITAGSFTIDINSLIVDTTSVTEPGKKAMDLQNHLKSADFFDAEKFPTAKFDITSVTPFDATKDKSLLEGATHNVSGNLTIKGNAVNITFPAKITVSDAELDVIAKFNVDRTTWGLNLGTEGDPSNWMVSKEFELDINLKAKAK